MRRMLVSMERVVGRVSGSSIADMGEGLLSALLIGGWVLVMWLLGM